MYISKVRVLNFKSYRDSNEVEFRPGFNIITGQNSAGKTALLEALTLRFTANPTLSMKTIPTAGTRPDAATTVIMTLVISGDELLTSLRSMGPDHHMFPMGAPDESQAAMDRRLRQLLQQPELRVSFRFVRRPNSEEWASDDPRFLGIYGPAQNPNGQWLGFPVVATAAGLRILGRMSSTPVRMSAFRLLPG